MLRRGTAGQRRAARRLTQEEVATLRSAQSKTLSRCWLYRPPGWRKLAHQKVAALAGSGTVSAAEVESLQGAWMSSNRFVVEDAGD